MSDFKNLTDEDVQRIERGIVYSFPARDGTGLIVCVGTYGDLSNQVRVRGCTTMGDFLTVASNRLSHWFCHRINGILGGEEISGSASWKIVDGMPVAPPYITPLASGGYVVDEIAKAQFYKAEGAHTVDEEFQHFPSYTGYSSLPVAEIENLRVAYHHGASGHVHAPSVSLPEPDRDGNIYGLPAHLFTEPKGVGSAFHDYVAQLSAQANANGEQHLLEGQIVAKAKRLGLI